MIVATAGHIDHGKTALVQALTGIDTDRLPEEKKRGMSIDLGFAYQPMAGGGIMGFVDVPGHERFIRNMLAGVAGIDYAILVIAADDGPMPQTVEHLAILDMMGVTKGAVALSKIDRVDEARITEVTRLIEQLIATSGLAGAEICPLSAHTGAGMEVLRANLDGAVENLVARAQDGNFRLAVDRCFTLAGAGLVVAGSVFSGTVSVGDHLIVSPDGIEVRVRSIHAQNQEAELGVAGQRCAINIAGGGLRKVQVYRGSWLLAGEIHDPVPRFDARLKVLPGESSALRHWTPVHVHLGAAEVPGRVAVLEGKSIAPGEDGLVQVVLDRRVGALTGDRFVLRDNSARRTVAGGAVIDPFAPSRGRAKPERIAFLGAMELGGPELALGALAADSPGGVDMAHFATAWNLHTDDMAALVELSDLVLAGPPEKQIGLAPDGWAKLGSEVLEALGAWHEAQPDKAGPGADALRKVLPTRLAKPLLESLLGDLTKNKKINKNGASYALPDFMPALEGRDAALWNKVSALLRDGYTKPPVVHEIASQLSANP
ncbi:MAG: selenocysteine-specific translation elongation factor, partial [Rhodospirillales bacterium]|nr:selenocysteine-specific translation elongation factor [Rhodospirillales bacterium]